MHWYAVYLEIGSNQNR